MEQQTDSRKMIRTFLLRRSRFYLLLLISMTQFTFSQPMLQRIVISSGGIVQSSSNTALYGTIGQAIIGIEKDNTSEARLGFWYPNPDLQATDVPYSGEKTAHKATLTVYPNPLQLTGIVMITLPHAGMARLSIVDLLGREQIVVSEGDFKAGIQSFEIDLSKIPSGIYYAGLQFDNISQAIHIIHIIR